MPLHDLWRAQNHKHNDVVGSSVATNTSKQVHQEILVYEDAIHKFPCSSKIVSQEDEPFRMQNQCILVDLGTISYADH